MSQFYLWCPENDGTQHTACWPDEQAAAYPWGRRLPTIQEAREYMLRDISGHFATFADLRLRYHTLRGLPEPTACHFDRVDVPEAELRWFPEHVPATANIGPWGWGREHYPTIKQRYVCSVHRRNPSVVLMRHHAFYDRWYPIQERLMTTDHRQYTDAELRRRYGRYYAEVVGLVNNYGFRWMRAKGLTRTVETSHEVW